MGKDFVTYKQALVLKELGFDEPCLLVYHQKKLVGVTNHEASGFILPLISNKKLGSLTCTAPLKQQAFRFFRDKHNMNSQIAFCEYAIKTENSWKFTFDNPTGRQYWEGEYKTYEEAEQNCLDKLIEICKNK